MITFLLNWLTNNRQVLTFCVYVIMRMRNRRFGLLNFKLQFKHGPRCSCLNATHGYLWTRTEICNLGSGEKEFLRGSFMYSCRNLSCNTPNDSFFFPYNFFLILYFSLFHLWFLCSFMTTFLERVLQSWIPRYNVRSLFTLRTFRHFRCLQPVLSRSRSKA